MGFSSFPTEGPTKKGRPNKRVEGPQPLGNRKSVPSSTSSPAAGEGRRLCCRRRVGWRRRRRTTQRSWPAWSTSPTCLPPSGTSSASRCARASPASFESGLTSRPTISRPRPRFVLLILLSFVVFYGCLLEKVGVFVGFVVGGGLDGLLLWGGGVGWDWWPIA